MLQATLKIQGRVQGVCYRAEAQEKAQQLGLAGWIKNEADKSVSICVQGHPPSVQEFINWAHQGPDGAEVETMDGQLQMDPQNRFRDFEIIL